MKIGFPFYQMKIFGGKLAIGALAIFLSSQCVAGPLGTDMYNTVHWMLDWDSRRQAEPPEIVEKSMFAQIYLLLQKELFVLFLSKGLNDNFSRMSLSMAVEENSGYIFVRNLQVVWHLRVQNDPRLMDTRTTNMLVLDYPENHTIRDAVANRICRLLGGSKMHEISKGPGSSMPIDVLHRDGFQDWAANVSDVANNAVLIFSNKNISDPELEKIELINTKYPQGNLFSLSGIDCKK